MGRRLVSLTVAFIVCSGIPAPARTVPETLETVRSLVVEHRFQEAVDLLEPLWRTNENRETRYVLAAELGRAHFHLGNYRTAHDYLRQAVILHPERIESALYLLATSYVLGNHDQALSILQEVLRSGARDLYLAVTLPGERSFLADPAVWAVLEQHSVPLDVEAAEGSVGSVRLGQQRSQVVSALGIPTGVTSKAEVSARAGPYAIWSFAFDEHDTLVGITLSIENIVKYTPYRPHIGGLEWRTTVAELLATLGPPATTRSLGEDLLEMTFLEGSTKVSMVFGQPRPPRPPAAPADAAMLLVVQLASVPAGAGAGSDSMSK
jgi:hypothetical protein